MVAVTVFVLGMVSMPPFTGDAGTGKVVVRGIVEYVDGPAVTVAGKTYDLKKVPLQDGYGLPLAEPPDLRGKTVEILIRNRKIESVTVYPTLPQ